MRIGIDAHMVGERETGNESVILGLCEGLRQLESAHEYRLFSPRPERLWPQATARLRPRRLLPVPAPVRIMFGLPVAARHERLDLLHVTYVAPPFATPYVVLVHDVAYKLFPDAFSPRVRWQLSLLVPLSIARARRVLTVSESARADLERFYPHAMGKTVAVHNGLRGIFRRLADPAALAPTRRRYQLPRQFILAVGDLQPRKNLGALLDAFHAIASDWPDVDLVIVGKDKWRGDSVTAKVAALGLTNRVKLTGYVPDDDLVALYNLTELFVYPSRYEGFGLPPLEAMACGAPTITGDQSALPEVVGDAALTFAPDRTDELIEVMRRALADADLRARLSAAGLARAARFSWVDNARQVERVFEAAIARPNG